MIILRANIRILFRMRSAINIFFQKKAPRANTAITQPDNTLPPD